MSCLEVFTPLLHTCPTQLDPELAKRKLKVSWGRYCHSGGQSSNWGPFQSPIQQLQVQPYVAIQ